MVQKSFIKMKEDHVVDIYKVIINVENFDEAMPIVQVRVGRFEVRDVLLDGDFDAKIIFGSLKNKIQLKKIQLAPFVVQMAN
jgi:hypothetical protein